MFRFPIRNSISNISSAHHTAKDIEKMISEYVQNEDSLLFLKNLEEISFFTIDIEHGQTTIKCLHREVLKYERRVDGQKRKHYRDNLTKERGL